MIAIFSELLGSDELGKSAANVVHGVEERVKS
jgi:hypothetical protein